MVSSPRPPRPGPAATATGARKPSARCASALGWVVAMNVLLAATQIAVGSAVKSLALVADGVHTLSDALAAYVAHLAVRGRVQRQIHINKVKSMLRDTVEASPRR